MWYTYFSHLSFLSCISSHLTIFNFHICYSNFKYISFFFFWLSLGQYILFQKHTNVVLDFAAAAVAAKLFQSCPTLCDPIDGSPPGFPSLGFSRQEHWSGLPFPSPVHESEKWKWSLSVMSESLRPHGLQPTRLLHPWDFPGESTGVATTAYEKETYWLCTTNPACISWHPFLCFLLCETISLDCFSSSSNNLSYSPHRQISQQINTELLLWLKPCSGLWGYSCKQDRQQCLFSSIEALEGWGVGWGMSG